MIARNFDKILLNRATYRFNLFDPFSIRVLMVTDDEVSYGVADGSNVITHQFSLMELVRALTDPPFGLPWITVTRAHRRLDPMGVNSGAGRVTPADIENFTFSEAALASFDQVWLFGAEHQADGPGLSPAELQALAHFMNAGGGVFATGDHVDLGVTLCGAIPRVRSMRKWFWPGPGPLGEPVAPDPVSANRHDTTRDNPPGQFPFDNQSDVIPMGVTPTLWGFLFWRYPHPLLSGFSGVIDVMPDHMHEGDVITPTGTDGASGWTGSGVPGGLGSTLDINGEMIVEYPVPVFGFGYQERPVIVAQADVIGGHTTPSSEMHVGSTTPTVSQRFACIGAYDGFRSGVGRVAVDSTWHHFFDLNLVGDPSAPPPKNQGFTATPAGKNVLARIENYFVNIATWLTPNKGFFLFGWLLAILRAPTTFELIRMAPMMPDHFVLQVGDAVYADLLRFLPPCAIIDTVLSVYREIATDWQLPNPPDPWATGQEPVAVNPENWAAAALGGMAAALERTLHEEGELKGRAVQALMHRGMARGLRTFAEVQAAQAGATLRDAEAMLTGLKGRE